MNTEQLGVITSPAPWNIVLAGPGSGKSRVIVERARFLKEQGVNPSAMAFVTFTNIGAKVLRRRLTEAVGHVGFIGTLHGMMLQLLRREDPRWVLIGEDDSNEFLARHAKLMGYKGTDIDLQAARSLDDEAVLTPALRSVRAYRSFMRSERMLDFDMVLSEGYALLRQGNRNPWTHWAVDEFQDSGPIDAKIYLAANPLHLLVVGDPDQSIFGFRNARPANVTEYWEDPRFSRHIMGENYRCAELICNAANSVIELNADRIAKKTKSAVEFEGEVEVSKCSNDNVERGMVVTIASKRIAEGIPPHEIAVLCRTNRLANEMRDALRDACIPIADVEPEKKPRDWPLLLLTLSLIATPTSWAMARMLARLQAKFAKADQNAAEEAVISQRHTGAKPTAAWAFPSAQVILSLNADLSRYGIGRASHSLMAERIRLYGPETIEELIACLRESPETKSTRGVNVMTVHAAKGEEWDVVIVPAMDLYARKCSEAAEERRLLFVAITRARRFLNLSGATERKILLPTGQTIMQKNPYSEMFGSIA